MGSPRRQSGQGSLEYLCVLAVAAAVVALLLGLQPGIRGWAATTVGSITASMDGGPRTAAPPSARPTEQSGGGGAWGILRGLADAAGFVPVVGDFVDAGVCAFEVAQGNFGDAALSCASAVPFLGTAANAARVARRTDDLIDAARTVERGDDIVDAGRAACRSNSFLPTTPVLMGDGSSRAISAIAVGDQVLATDPLTGTTGPRTVAAVIEGRGTKELVSVTMAAGAGTVTATAAHPFFVTGIARWVEADDLRPGDQLLTPDGRGIRVLDVLRFRDYRTVHNLSVEGIPTFYTGREPVLVHNCNLGPQAISRSQRALNQQAREAALRNFSSQYFRFGNETFLLDKRGMDHILARHHPTYWDGTTRRTQGFFDPSTSVADVQRLAGDVLRQNRATLADRGANASYTLFGTVDGVRYQIGISRGRVGQFFPVHQ